MRQTFLHKIAVITINIVATNHTAVCNGTLTITYKITGNKIEIIPAKADKITGRLCFITTTSLSQSNFGNLALK